MVEWFKVLSKDKRAAVVVYYRYVLGLKGKDIAKILEVAEATVTRALDAAEELGYFKREIVQFTPRYKEIIEELSCEGFLRDQLLAREIHRRYRSHLRNVVVVPTQKHVGPVAAAHFWEIFQRGHIRRVGVLWGRTLRSIVDALGRWVTPDPDREVEFIPLFGELPIKASSELYEKAYQCSATTLAADLERMFKGRVSKFRSLSIPACVPVSFLRGPGNPDERKNRCEVVRKFVESVPSYREIFVDKPPLIESIDTLISSVGDLEHGWLEFGGPVASEDEWRQLRNLEVIGELAGRYVTEDRVDGFREGGVIQRVNSRVFGPSPGHYKRIAQKGREDWQSLIGGVILVAAEPRKARVVHTVVKNNCATDLIISKEVAEELRRILG
jgi:DNA-binding transcriptional regulator LsrR (DeoR family)